MVTASSAGFGLFGWLIIKKVVDGKASGLIGRRGVIGRLVTKEVVDGNGHFGLFGWLIGRGIIGRRGLIGRLIGREVVYKRCGFFYRRCRYFGLGGNGIAN